MNKDRNVHIHHAPQSNNFGGMILGVAIGATLTYLLTNKDGQKIKDMLLKEGARILDEVAKSAQEFEDKFESKAEDELAERLEEVKDKVAEVEQMVEDIPPHIEQIQKKGRRFFMHKSSHHHSAES